VKKTDELNYVEIGKRMKNKRVELKLTQEKLSELIDVSPSYVSEIERGTSICSLSTITKIASVLALNLDYLVLGINPSNVDTTFGELLNSIPEEH
jgi:transcriptional regulator with XRE-family HTH domain